MGQREGRDERGSLARSLKAVFRELELVDALARDTNETVKAIQLLAERLGDLRDLLEILKIAFDPLDLARLLPSGAREVLLTSEPGLVIVRREFEIARLDVRESLVGGFFRRRDDVQRCAVGVERAGEGEANPIRASCDEVALGDERRGGSVSECLGERFSDGRHDGTKKQGGAPNLS